MSYEVIDNIILRGLESVRGTVVVRFLVYMVVIFTIGKVIRDLITIINQYISRIDYMDRVIANPYLVGVRKNTDMKSKAYQPVQYIEPSNSQDLHNNTGVSMSEVDNTKQAIITDVLLTVEDYIVRVETKSLVVNLLFMNLILIPLFRIVYFILGYVGLVWILVMTIHLVVFMCDNKRVNIKEKIKCNEENQRILYLCTTSFLVFILLTSLPF